MRSAPLSSGRLGEAASRVGDHGLQQHLQVPHQALRPLPRRTGPSGRRARRRAPPLRPGRSAAGRTWRSALPVAERLHLHAAQRQPLAAAARPGPGRRSPGRAACASGSRSAASSSTSCSKGRSWCAYAPSAASRTRPSSSRKVGSPPRSPRSTSVLTKKPISPSGLQPAPARDRAPHHHVVLSGVAAQQRLPRRQQRHEQRRPLAPRERPRASATSSGGQATRRGSPRARSAPPARGRSVGSSSSGGAPARRSASRPSCASSTSPLSQRRCQSGVVGVLDRQLRQRAAPRPGEGGVERARPRAPAPHAPAVADDVVQREAAARAPPRPAAAASLRSSGPRARSNGRQRLRRGQPLAPPPRVALRGRAPQVHHGQRHRGGRVDHLHGPAVLLHEGGAQRLVPPHQLAPGSRRSAARVQRAAQAQRVRHVVGGAPRLELVHEPEPLLRERQRQRLPRAAPAPAAARRPGGPCALQRLHALGQAGHGGRLEERPQRQLHPERLPHPRDHLRRQQRVPAQLEEVVVHAHLLHPQHLRPDPASSLLHGRPRAPRTPAGQRVAPAPAAPGGPPSRWASAAALQRARTRPAPCTPAAAARSTARSSAVATAVAPPPHHVRHQALLAPARPPAPPRRPPAPAAGSASAASISPGSIRKPRTFTCCVDPPQELHVSRRPATAPGRRCGTAAPPARPERVRDEALRRQLRAAQVAARHARAADVQLARHPDRHRAPPAGPARTAARSAIRRPSVTRSAASTRAGRRVDGRLRGAVVVPDRHAREARACAPHQLLRERLAAQQDRHQARRGRAFTPAPPAPALRATARARPRS